MALDEDQKEFIRCKVEELGSLESVQKFYVKEDNVTKFAHAYALKIYRNKEVQINEE